MRALVSALHSLKEHKRLVSLFLYMQQNNDDFIVVFSKPAAIGTDVLSLLSNKYIDRVSDPARNYCHETIQTHHPDSAIRGTVTGSMSIMATFFYRSTRVFKAIVLHFLIPFLCCRFTGFFVLEKELPLNSCLP